MTKSYYTLEKHLQAVCEQNNEFEILNATWKLNKKGIPRALSSIAFNFPHFSLHDRTHSETIVRNIESFLGEDRIKNLSPSDTWLILMSAYTHDLGMVVFSKSIEARWEDNSFKDVLIQMASRKVDADLSDAAKILLNFKDNKNNIKITDSAVNPIKVRRALILVASEYFRRNHHVRSMNVLKGSDVEMGDLLANFYSDMIPNRFSDILGNIAFSHGTSFEYILNELDYEANGLGSDKIHPRLISCLLKLGDLLDVDDLRFDSFSEKVLGDLPQISLTHKKKHSSIKHLLITPSSIEITIDCENNEVYRVARQWFDWLEDEVKNQSREWTLITPKDLNGLPPTISNGKVKVLFDGAEPKRELLDLRFSIKPEKAIEIFEGGGIYDNTDFVYLREIIQNAVDASKIQLWKDIKGGRYNSILAKHLNINASESELASLIVQSIKFPEDIPSVISQNYQVNLFFEWEDLTKNNLIIKLRDNGTGISEKNLLRMVNAVGESRSNDKIFADLKVGMPYWLKPTGAFGIGLQSIFLVADTFTISTKAEDSESMEIVFNSSKFGGYSYIKKDKPSIIRGTQITIKITSLEFYKSYNEHSQFAAAVIDKYDKFSADEDLFLYVLEDYLNRQFKNIQELNITFPNNRQIKASTLKDNLHTDNIIASDYSLDGNIKAMLLDDKSDFQFIVHENSCVGSSILISLQSNFNENGRTYYSIESQPDWFEYFVRSIPVDSDMHQSYDLFRYLHIHWDLLNPNSDKILNIARSKLVKRAKERHDELFLTSIMPIVIQLMWKLLITAKDIGETNELKIMTAAFHLRIMAEINKIELKEFFDFDKFSIPNFWVRSKVPNQPVTMESFYKANTILLEHFETYNYLNQTPAREIVRKNILSTNDIEIIVLDREYLGLYFSYGFQIDKLFNKKISGFRSLPSFYILKRSKSVKDQSVEIEDLQEYFFIDPRDYRTGSRIWYYPIEPFSRVLSINTNSQSNPRYSNIAIISPFKNFEIFSFIYKELHVLIKKGSKKEITKVLRDNHIENLVPPKMIDYVVANSFTSLGPIRNEILNSYSDFAAEILLHNKGNANLV